MASAVEARQRLTTTTGDRARLIAAGRAKFAASLASVARLKCVASNSDVDSVLAKALEVARRAEATSSQNEAALRWTEADLIATDAVALLVNQIPIKPEK
jgi:hypothetical protein